MESIDIYSKSNPALNSIILWYFIRSYMKENDAGCELPIIYTVLPIILSDKLESSFESTNVNTGFLKWINNNPQVINQLNDRVVGTRSVTKKSFLFSVSTGIVVFDGVGFSACDNAFKKLPGFPKTNIKMNKLITNSKKLGAWMGKVGNARDVLINLRLV